MHILLEWLITLWMLFLELLKITIHLKLDCVMWMIRNQLPWEMRLLLYSEKGFWPWDLTMVFGIWQCWHKSQHMFWQPQHFKITMLFVGILVLVLMCFVCSHCFVDAEKILFPIKCFVTTIALYLDPSHIYSFILHNDFLLLDNFFHQRIFHSFACVPCAKITNFEDLVLVSFF